MYIHNMYELNIYALFNPITKFNRYIHIHMYTVDYTKNHRFSNFDHYITVE